MPVVARALMRPLRMNSTMVGTASNIMSTWPLSTSVRAPELADKTLQQRFLVPLGAALRHEETVL